MGFSDIFIDVSDLPQTGYGFVQVLCVGIVYGYILMFASNMISDGSELLLLVPSVAGIVGSIVLPVLGAVPDGCIVLFSGIGSDAQENLSVGIGALAGSTIMLLTVPWFLSIVGGRVNVVNNTAIYKSPKLTPPNKFGLFDTGINLGKATKLGAWFMIVTSFPYLLIQIPGLFVVSDSSTYEASFEEPFAIVAFVLCMGFLGGYLYFQYQSSLEPDESNSVENYRLTLMKEAIAQGKITLLGLMTAEFKQHPPVPGSPRASYQSQGSFMGPITTETTPLNTGKVSDAAMDRLKVLLRPFFNKYDRDGSGSLDLEEVGALFKDLGETTPVKDLKELFNKMDTDKSGSIDYDEFVLGTAEYVISRGLKSEQIPVLPEIHQDDGEGKQDDEEEQEEIPEDLANLSPEEQQFNIKLRAFYMMAIGTVLVLIVSDPMVDVLTEIGARINVSSFYVAFVLAPIASNASEVIASYNYAQKKTSTSIAVSISALQGACVLNNTFVLGVFLLLIFSQGLYWEYFAETLTILTVQVIVALYSFKKTHTVFDGFCILALYPASIFLVYLLEFVGWN